MIVRLLQSKTKRLLQSYNASVLEGSNAAEDFAILAAYIIRSLTLDEKPKLATFSRLNSIEMEAASCHFRVESVNSKIIPIDIDVFLERGTRKMAKYGTDTRPDGSCC